jgi:hypothetical protein
MYNEQLEKLIEMALIDGDLSDRDKQVLMKKAESFGIDLDEFEMVLDARLYEKKMNQENATSSQAPPRAAAPPPPKSDKFGDMKKCPSCGSTVGSFLAKCSDCGFEFSNVEATGSTQRLYQELMRVEEEERNRKENKEGKGLRSLTSFIMGDDSDPLAEAQLNGRIFKRKISVVSMFPVPNTKTDILEFLSMALSEGGKKIGGFFSTMSLEEKDYIRAWRAKAEQVVIKARFSLKEDKKLLDEINAYAKQLEIK